MNKKSIVFRCLFVLLYAAMVAVAHSFGITCIFKGLLGIECPGCGITRALLSLSRGDVSAAIAYNPMVFSVPLLVVYFVTDGRLLGKKVDRWIPALLLLGFLVTWIFKLI